MLAKRPGSITTDPIQQARGRDSRTVHRRGSSDDEAAAKPMSRRVPGYPPGYTMRASGTERRGNLDREARCGEMKHEKCGCRNVESEQFVSSHLFKRMGLASP